MQKIPAGSYQNEFRQIGVARTNMSHPIAKVSVCFFSSVFATVGYASAGVGR